MTENTVESQLTDEEIEKKAKELVSGLLLEQGLYSSLSIEGQVGFKVDSILRNATLGIFDCYCTRCGRVTPFIMLPLPIPHAGGGLIQQSSPKHPPSAFGVRTSCQRDRTYYIYTFFRSGDKIIKIGQFPSMGDVSFGELKEIERGLDRVDRKELGTAIGLFAHGAASGAFVYLRRVFERMIRRAYDREIGQGGSIHKFDGLRMNEKIAALKNQLPERVVRNSGVFSVLSAGIHELSDDECQNLFPVVKSVIFQLLEEEEHRRKKDLADKQTDAALRNLLSETQRSAPEKKAAVPSASSSLDASAPRPSDNQA